MFSKETYMARRAKLNHRFRFVAIPWKRREWDELRR